MREENGAGTVAVELERLRGAVAEGLARIDGRLDVVLQRTDRAEEDVRKLREDHDQDIADLRTQVEELKRLRWPLPAVAALTGVGALTLTLWELAAR